MNPYQNVALAWPDTIKHKAFDMYMQRHSAEDVERKLGVPAATYYRWSWENNWREIRARKVTDYQARADAIGQASILTALTNLTASSKVVKQAIACLDSGTPLSPSELASIALAISDSSELLCRLLGK